MTAARTPSPRRGRGTHAAVIAADPTETSKPAPTTPTSTAAPSTTPSTGALDAADPGTWIIGFDGVGPVVLGPSLEDQRQVLPSFADITDPICVGAYLDLKAPNGFSLLFVSGSDKPEVTAAITFGSNSTTTSDSRATTPKTSAGIGIDSTQEELLAAYPGIQQTGSYGSDEYPYLGLTDGNGTWIVFGISQGKIGRIQIANEATLPIENGSVETMPSERCPA